MWYDHRNVWTEQYSLVASTNTSHSDTPVQISAWISTILRFFIPFFGISIQILW